MRKFKDIKFACPKCDKHLVIDSRGAGFLLTCPDCQLQMRVPDQSGTPACEYIQTPAPAETHAVPVRNKEEPEFQGYGMTAEAKDNAPRYIHKIFANYPKHRDLSPESQSVLKTIQSRKSKDFKLERLVAAEIEFGKDYRQRHLDEMLDFLLYFLGECLKDHKITGGEIAALEELRALLDIQDGDLYNKRKDEIRKLLASQIDWMEDDFRITRTEELYLVDLQRIFDLSYDQLLELTRPHVTEILNNLYLQFSIAPREDIAFQIDQLKQAFCMIHYIPFESPSKEGADQVADRMIPQSVKDAVWRRDEGKCAVCNSQKNLEFDHIIPFSLGGANTYRNVQLLCQNCNRTKSASIG